VKLVACTLIVCAVGLAALASAADGDDANKTSVLVAAGQPVESGHWNYTVRRSTAPWDCGAKSAGQKCVDQDVFIHNQSDQTLECNLRVDYKAPDGRVHQSFDTPAVVFPRSRSRAHRHVTDPAEQAEVTRLNCNTRPPYRRIPKVEGCTYEMNGPLLEDYYPPSAIRQTLEGPVTVAFTVLKASGKATDAVVAESSLVPELDAAALKFIAAQRFKTACPGTRFDVRIRFRLRTQIVSARG